MSLYLLGYWTRGHIGVIGNSGCLTLFTFTRDMFTIILLSEVIGTCVKCGSSPIQLSGNCAG